MGNAAALLLCSLLVGTCCCVQALAANAVPGSAGGRPTTNQASTSGTSFTVPATRGTGGSDDKESGRQSPTPPRDESRPTGRVPDVSTGNDSDPVQLDQPSGEPRPESEPTTPGSAKPARLSPLQPREALPTIFSPEGISPTPDLSKSRDYVNYDDMNELVIHDEAGMREIVLFSTGVRVATEINRELEAADFEALRSRDLRGLGLLISVYRIPGVETITSAIASIEAKFTDLIVAPNDHYELLGRNGTSMAYAEKLMRWRPGSTNCGMNQRIGLVDTPVDVNHPALVNARIKTSSVIGAGQQAPRADHGTALAAILVGNRSLHDYTGLLPQAELYAVNAFRARDKDYIDTSVELIVYAFESLVNSRVDAINMSLGGPPNRVLESTVKAVRDRHVAIIAAAGNGGPDAAPVFPAAYPGVIAVTAVDGDESVYRQANHGAYVEFAAPGVDMWVAKPGNGGIYLSGTSYAAPFVTAAYVVMRALHAEESLSSLHERLVMSARDLGSPGRDAVYGFGLIQTSATCPQSPG